MERSAVVDPAHDSATGPLGAALVGNRHECRRIGRGDRLDGEGFEEPVGELLVVEFLGEQQRLGEESPLVASADTIGPEPQEGHGIVGASGR